MSMDEVDNGVARRPRRLHLALIAGALLVATGCYAPLRTVAIPASSLPDSFRTPTRTAGPPLNLARLTRQPPHDYLLGPEDVLEVTVPGLFDQAEVKPLRTQVMSNGEVHLPLVGSVQVGGMNLVQANNTINAAYADGFLVEPRVNVVLVQPATVSVLVLGQVKQPGTHLLPKYTNDVGHALGAAFGLTEQAADYIEVHRHGASNMTRQPHVTPQLNSPQPASFSPRHPMAANSVAFQPAAHRPATPTVAPVAPAQGFVPVIFDQRFMGAQQGAPAAATSPAAPVVQQVSRPVLPPPVQYQSGGWTPYMPMPSPQYQSFAPQPNIQRIPLRGYDTAGVLPDQITLQSGDVVVVPNRKHEVFYVVGRLNLNQTVRFSVGDRERELGVGLILPRDREIDVVTAVTMAGYIDPIDSPTTVTVQRQLPDGCPMLVKVDLIKARYDRRETILVQPGDIIYLNPDAKWWFRRSFDRVINDAFSAPYNLLVR